jgi:hypothetical protein
MHLERLSIAIPEWEEQTNHFHDRTIFQSAAWLSFLVDTQHGEPIFAVLMDRSEVQGYFCGMMVRKFGIPIFGSPMPGWTTAYMGLNLLDGVGRRGVMEAIANFAFRELGCIHLEIMDRRLTVDDAQGSQFYSRLFGGFEVDLTQDEDALLAKMSSPCRTCIRKALKYGLQTRISTEAAFVDHYYAQLEDVFAKQKLVPTYSRERVQCLMRHLVPEMKVLPLEAIDSTGRCIASAISVALNDTAFLWGSASWRQFQFMRPNELLLWSSMRYWKFRGVQKFDMGGGGDYKRKYGGRPIVVPWLRRSKYPGLEGLRTTAAEFVRLQQHLRGRWTQNPHPGEESPDIGGTATPEPLSTA